MKKFELPEITYLTYNSSDVVCASGPKEGTSEAYDLGEDDIL